MPRRSYASVVTTTDHYIGKILDRLEKLGQGVEVTHRLECAGLFSWLGYPILRRVCSVFLKRSNMALEQQLRRTTVQSRYARPSGRRA